MEHSTKRWDRPPWGLVFKHNSASYSIPHPLITMYQLWSGVEPWRRPSASVKRWIPAWISFQMNSGINGMSWRFYHLGICLHFVIFLIFFSPLQAFTSCSPLYLMILLLSNITSESSLHHPCLTFLKVRAVLLRMSRLLHLHLAFMTQVDLTGKSIRDQSFHMDSPEQADWWRQQLLLISSYFVQSVDSPCWAVTAALSAVSEFGLRGDGCKSLLNERRKRVRADEQGKIRRRQEEKEQKMYKDREQENAEAAFFTHVAAGCVCVCVMKLWLASGCS